MAEREDGTLAKARIRTQTNAWTEHSERLRQRHRHGQEQKLEHWLRRGQEHEQRLGHDTKRDKTQRQMLGKVDMLIHSLSHVHEHKKGFGMTLRETETQRQKLGKERG